MLSGRALAGRVSGEVRGGGDDGVLDRWHGYAVGPVAWKGAYVSLSGLIYRRADKADLRSIRSITAAVCETPEVYRFVSERFCSTGEGCDGYRPDVGRTLVAEQNGEVIGYLAWREDETVGVIDTHAVRPDRQGRGTGSGLLTALLGWFRAEGIRQIEATVAEGFLRARRIYEARGFREIGRSVRMARQANGEMEMTVVLDGETGMLEQRQREGYGQTAVWIHYEKRFRAS